ncbi:MFS transporter [Sphaerisporangium krabiense]|uniref:MFS family permease n=1 Tax=Sphaerisporangium krabiense TaxID=763782 RepID=A0A7W8Z959_9ACTN|nr:MFS transporter [Sphaerisporangium krabiense]MBB5629776.1 MFS family permease [Sphaerisporangium krabiense]GII63875.1 MFS transporter [Sphaerisporangium krabiense]
MVRDRLLVACLCSAGMVVALQQTLVIPLLPDFPRLLDTSVQGASWLVTATLLTGAVCTPVLTRLADMVGKRRVVLVCLAAVAAGGVLGAVASSLPGAIVARAVAGAGVPLIPISVAILQEELPDGRLPARVALLSSTLAVGTAVGMPLAGVMAEALSWRAVFWFSGLAGLAMIAAVVRLVPASKGRAPGRFDVPGAVVLAAAVAALLLVITQAGAWGWTSGAVIALAAGSALATAVWITLELRVRHPLVDVRVSVRPVVLLANAGSLLIGFVMFMNLLVTSQLLQLPASTDAGLGMDSMRAGLWMTPIALSFGLFASASSPVTRRFGAQATLVAGALLLSVAYVGRIFLSDGLWQIIVASIAVSAGSAFAYAALPVVIMRAVPPWQISSANGFNNLLRSIGTSMSSAVLAAVLAAATARTAGEAVHHYRQAFEHMFLIGALVAFAAFLVTLPLIRLADRPAASSVS